MALIVNLYSDWMCENPIKTVSLGVAGVTGQYNSLSQWQRITSYAPRFSGEVYDIYRLNAYDNMGFALGGGSALYDYDFSSTIPYSVNVPTDTDNQGGGTPIYNPVFIGRGGIYQQQTVATALSLVDFDSPTYQGTKYLTIRMRNYSQVPDSGTRTSWNYRNSYPIAAETNAPMPANTAYPLVKLFQITIEEKRFYMLACGVSGSNALRPAGSSQPTTLCLIPEIYFKDQPTDPYVGPVSKESAETSFVPTRDRYRDSVEGRDGAILGDNPLLRDPMGLGSQNSQVKLIWQGETQYQLMVASIFRGTSDSFMGTLGDYGQMLTSAQHKRDKDEADIMSKGILSCKLVPYNLSWQLISQNYWQDPTICGYRWQGSTLNVGITGGQLCTGNIAVNNSWATIYPTRWFNSFLDYEPHTSVVLYVPFCGTVKIDPSALYNKGLRIVTFCDVVTGLLSVDIHLVDTDGRDYIYTTLQGNCGIDLPVIGAGSNAGQGISKIAGGIAGLVNGKDITGNIFKTMEGLNGVDKSTPVGHFSNANMAPYFAPRQAYLMFCVPKPANPNKFITLYGGESNISGPLSQFKGYLEVSAVDLGTTTATEAEKEEIIRLMKAGVFNGSYNNDGEVT